ncbi:hypothetical protein D3C76_1785510 [compost metagenome]
MLEAEIHPKCLPQNRLFVQGVAPQNKQQGILHIFAGMFVVFHFELAVAVRQPVDPLQNHIELIIRPLMSG